MIFMVSTRPTSIQVRKTKLFFFPFLSSSLHRHPHVSHFHFVSHSHRSPRRKQNFFSLSESDGMSGYASEMFIINFPNSPSGETSRKSGKTEKNFHFPSFFSSGGFACVDTTHVWVILCMKKWNKNFSHFILRMEKCLECYFFCINCLASRDEKYLSISMLMLVSWFLSTIHMMKNFHVRSHFKVCLTTTEEKNSTWLRNSHPQGILVEMKVNNSNISHTLSSQSVPFLLSIDIWRFFLWIQQLSKAAKHKNEKLWRSIDFEADF